MHSSVIYATFACLSSTQCPSYVTSKAHDDDDDDDDDGGGDDDFF